MVGQESFFMFSQQAISPMRPLKNGFAFDPGRQTAHRSTLRQWRDSMRTR